MIRHLALVAAAAALTACGNDGRPATDTGQRSARSAVDEQPSGMTATVRVDWVYTLTHVQIVDEGGVGPEPIAMAHALGAYRRGLVAEGLEGEGEAARWATLTEIRWTAEELAGGGTYDGEGIVRLTYPGCVTDSALFALLLEHYQAEGLELEADTWIAQLAEELEVCN